MADKTVVDRLYSEFSRLLAFLLEANEPSLEVTANEQCRKALLLAAASHFETVITEIVSAWLAELTPYNPQVARWVHVHGLTMKYHQLFKWEKRDAAAFDGLLGGLFKDYMRKEMQTDDAIQAPLRDFLGIGESRNRLVHQNFGLFTLEKTTDDIYVLYQSAQQFPPLLVQKLRDFCADRGCLAESSGSR